MGNRPQPRPLPAGTTEGQERSSGGASPPSGRPGGPSKACWDALRTEGVAGTCQPPEAPCHQDGSAGGSSTHSTMREERRILNSLCDSKIIRHISAGVHSLLTNISSSPTRTQSRSEALGTPLCSTSGQPPFPDHPPGAGPPHTRAAESADGEAALASGGVPRPPPPASSEPCFSHTPTTEVSKSPHVGLSRDPLRFLGNNYSPTFTMF